MSAKPVAIRKVEGFKPIAEMSPAEVYDEFGFLDYRKQQREPEEKRLAALKAWIQQKHSTDPAGESLTVEGHEWRLQLGAREMERKIVNMPRLHKWICASKGLAFFLGLCRINLSAIDSLEIPAEKLREIVTSEQTGNRRIKAVLKSLPQQAA